MVKTILLYITDKEDGLKAIQYLVDDIKANDEAHHKLYFKFLFNDAYYISMGTTDKDGKRYLIGDHELIFMPQTRLGSITDSFNQNKDIIFQKNCMVIAGDNEKAKAFRELIINWLLEKTEEINL